VRRGCARTGSRAGRPRVPVGGHQHAIGAHRFGDVLDPLLTAEIEFGIELAANMIIGGAGDDDAAGLRQALQAVCDVHAVAVNVVTLDDHVAKIDADAEIHPAVRGHTRRSFGLGALDLDRTVQGLNCAGELDQKPVAHGLDQPAAMFGNFRFEHFAQIGPEMGARCHLVDLAVARVADNVGDQDGGKPALHAIGPNDRRVPPKPPKDEPIARECNCLDQQARSSSSFPALHSLGALV